MTDWRKASKLAVKMRLDELRESDPVEYENIKASIAGRYHVAWVATADGRIEHVLKTIQHRGKSPSRAGDDAVRTLALRGADYRVFERLADAEEVPIGDFMHLVAQSLKAKNPQIFAQ